MGLKAIPHVERAVHAVSVLLAEHPDLDVNQAEAHVLAYLHAERRARVGELHAQFGHRRSTLTSVLDRLERRGLIARDTDAGDRRAVTATLSRAGASLAAKVSAVLSAYERTALREFTRDEIGAFHRVVAALAATRSA